MPNYMINICYGDLEKRKQSKHSTDNAFVMGKYREWSQKIAEKTLIAHKLRDGAGRRVDLLSGQITDGPYIETKESIGGFYIVNAANYDEAVMIASECPTLLFQGGYCEVREVEI